MLGLMTSHTVRYGGGVSSSQSQRHAHLLQIQIQLKAKHAWLAFVKPWAMAQAAPVRSGVRRGLSRCRPPSAFRTKLLTRGSPGRSIRRNRRSSMSAWSRHVGVVVVNAKGCSVFSDSIDILFIGDYMTQRNGPGSSIHLTSRRAIVASIPTTQDVKSESRAGS